LGGELILGIPVSAVTGSAGKTATKEMSGKCKIRGQLGYNAHERLIRQS